MRVQDPGRLLGALLVFLLATSLVCAQGPASCGFHLDILADGTSTHSAIADAPHAPGAIGGYPPGAPGNPYQAYASPGSMVRLRLSIPGGTIGPAPMGPGSRVTILYSIGTPYVLFPAGAGIINPCQPGQPIVITVWPPAGAIVDGVGYYAAVPPTAPADPGFPYKLEVDVVYPAGVGGPVQLQALIIDPSGTMIAISNGVSLLPGPSPNEQPLLPAMTGCGGFVPQDEGFAAIPTPPGFMFYGTPQPAAQVNTNGFIEFFPYGVTPFSCDFSGTPGDLGCPPMTTTMSPRVAVNHYDADYTLPPPMPRIGDITWEIAPPMAGLPTRHIVRWKHGPPWGAPPPFPDTDYASHVVELWGDDVNNQPVPVVDASGLTVLVDARSRVVVVRQEIHELTNPAVHAQLGIGPGPLTPAIPLCTPLAFWTLWGFPAYLTAPFEAVHMDPSTFGPWYPVHSHTQTNLALICDPPIVPPLPSSYLIQNH